MTEEALIALLFTVFGLFEFFNPAEAGQSHRGRWRWRNILYMVFVLSVGAFVSTLIFRALPINFRTLPEMSMLGVAAYALAYVFVTDFLYYWYHRAQHSFRSLWVLHELHHSDAEMNMITSYRTYWLDYPIQTVAVHAPVMSLLGFHGTGLLWAIVMQTFFLMFSHANIRLSLGQLNWVIVGPQLHRIHHSILPAHRDKNLAQAFPIFDVLFGTYYHPARDEYPPTGADELASDARFAETLTRPFDLWWKMLRR